MQVKRKRKEHRSLDSILFEDDGELEYFDVLNLLPLSNIRLEYNETDSSRDGNFARKKVHGLRDLRVLEYNEPSGTRGASPTRSSNATDEEKYKEHTVNEDNSVRDDNEPEKEVHEDLDSSEGANVSRRKHRETDENFGKDSEINRSANADQHGPSSSFKTDHRGADVENFVTSCEEEDHKIEKVEDYKSIWISNNEGRNEMSRRPQILKVVDNDVTRRRHRRSVVQIDAIVEDVPKDKRSQEITKEASERIDASVIKSINNVNEEDEVRERKVKVSMRCDGTFVLIRKKSLIIPYLNKFVSSLIVRDIINFSKILIFKTIRM